MKKILKAATLLLLLMTTATAWAKDPFGFVDICTGHNGSIYLGLWALDEDDYNARTTIHVYLRQNGQDKYVYNLGPTDIYRADEPNPQFAGYHKMQRYISVPVAGTYDVYVYVINAAGDGTNPLCLHTWNGTPYPIYASVTTSSPYTVTYNANGGSGAPSAMTKSHGIDLTLSSTQPTRSGYQFAGWNTAADGSGTTYSSGATYRGNANLTLYAQWAQSGNNSVEMASGTQNASHWSFSSGTANFGNTITVNYSGYLNLESVTLRRKTTNTYELNSSNISTAVSNFNSQPGSKLVFNANISEAQTFTCAEGEIDMNGHSSSKDLFIQNNVLGKTITIKNGTVTGTDGAVGLSDYYNGTVVLENMTVTGAVWTDGHPYVINGGTYAEIINDINANTSGTVTIYSGKISRLGNWDSGGTFTLYGGKYAINPSFLSYCTIPSGYSVQSNTDSDSGTYPWVVRNTSSPVANPYSHAVTEVTANRQWTFTMPSYDVEVVANYVPSIPYLTYNTSTKTFETLDAANCIAVTTSTTTMGAANTETWYVVNSNITINTRIEVLGTVNLILADGKSLRAEKGLHVPPGVTLNIYGQSGGTGQLYGFSNTNYIAGIGGNSGEASGTVNIHGGTIQAWGADNSAGIGGGTGGNGGTTTIYGGSVNSTGIEGGAGIGGGYGGNGGIITIYGGDVVARGSYKWGAGIGGGRNGNGGTITIYGGTINATGGEAAAAIGGGIGANCGIITITGGTVIAQAQTAYTDDNSQAIGSGAGTGISGGNLNIYGMKVYSSANAANPVDPANRLSTCQSKYARLLPCTSHNFVDGACTICGAYSPLTYLEYQTWMHSFEEHTFDGDYTIVDASTTIMGENDTETWYAVRNNVTTSNRIEVRGNVHLILCDGKTLTTTDGILVNAGNTLTIYGQSGGTGTLNAIAYNAQQSDMPHRNAGIGSNNNAKVGDIIIHGGSITAEGNSWSAGIGGGMYGGGGSVTIYGGTVNARGHDGDAEAIGHGSSAGSSVVKNIAEGLRAYVSGTLQTYNYLSWSLSQNGQTVTLTPCTEHSYTNGRCIYCNHSEWYTVTYNGNGSTGGSLPTDETQYADDGTGTVTVLGNTGNLIRTGYTFTGWNTAADGSGINFAPGATFTIYGNVTLYAKWTPITYTVCFHKNHDDAIGTMSEQTFTYDVAQPLRTNAFTLDDYLFVGWNTKTSGIVNYTDGQIVSNLANVQDAVVNLYALWTQNIYTITYDLEGGSVATPNPTTYTDLSAAITLVNPTREGYGFIGWTGTDLTEPTMRVTIPGGSTGNRSYTANWKEGVVYYAYNTTTNMFETFTVFDNYNTVTSETTSMSSGLYVVNDDVTISSRIEVTGTVDLILRDGKTLTATKGFHVTDGNTLNIYGQTNGTGALIATADGCNAAIGSNGSSTAGFGNYEKSGTVTIHGGTVTATGDLYAGGIGCGWNGQVGTIAVYGGTVTANGGSYGAGLGGGRDCRCGDIIILGGTVVATSANNPPLVYGNGRSGGSLSLGNVKVFYPSTSTTPVAYTDRVETCTTAPNVYPSVRVETCTSHNWDNNVCTLCGAHHVTVTYDSNGATGGTAPIDAFGYEPSHTFTVMDNTGNLVLTGYTFSHWNSAADGKGMNFAPGATFTINDDITLYAQWKLNDYTITYDLTGGTVATANPASYTIESAAITLNNPTRDGYTFAGWTGTDINGTATTVTIASGSTGNREYTATWTPITYTITYDLAGGSVTTDNATSYNVESGTITLVNPTKDGYTFAGWIGTGLTELTMTVTIPTGSMGNQSYIATWAAEQLELANNADNDNDINTATGDGMYYDVTLANRTLYRDGDWNTLVLPFSLSNFTGTPLEDATVKTLTSSDFAGGTLTMNFSDDLTSIEAGKPYIVKWKTPDLVISSENDWNTFASNVGNYAGKVVKLASDISVSSMVGGTFNGTLDGCGHTITVSLSSGSTEQIALFNTLGNATIKNLKIAGTITFGKHRPASIASYISGTTTIMNCWSSVAINSNYTSSDWIDGGAFVARVDSKKTLNIINCLFTGSIAYNANNYQGGGMVGWTQKNATTNITNCLFAPSALTMSTSDASTYVFVSGNVRGKLSGCYYNSVANNTSVLKKEGTYTTATGSDLQTMLGSGWEVRDGNVVPKMYPDIVNPVFTDVTISNTAANVETDYVDFVGTYSPVTYSDEEKSVLFLGGSSSLYYPDGTSATTIGACRGYFQLNGITAGDKANEVKAFVLNFENGSEETGIVDAEADSSLFTLHSSLSEWYDLSGRKLDGKPLQRGIYVNNGKKVVIK